ncbi:hypothetical protein HNQ35_001517 [Cerasibacillus quisquiliarum]|uniref:SipL SPOCS domain-containing protein n=1 Tax=Cerasibacillus quisquiliarum TaxID=227865 RepID=A0A511UVJ9_9BACI|nr:hypothetical protein [Cerasibacillus quisquiliarum]MBB5146315.1 hypothetical protein [Cerasibacillus quisquiliarum]GEN30640.1 hypothetical protein CQU01_08780 [Cerasibacillus quisquiliarum]
MSKCQSDKYCGCHCEEKPCYECEFHETKKCPPKLASDCIVVDSLICSKKIYKVAELSVPVSTLGDIISIGPGGVITPLISLTPDLNGVVSQITVVKDMVINTGYLPANVTILGIETPLQINIPFQQETMCPGVCPEDTVKESPYKIEAKVTQGIEALGVSVANILFKVVLSTNLTVTRPVITKAKNLKVVKDVNEDRCESRDWYG